MRHRWRLLIVVLLVVAMPTVAFAETGDLERRLQEAQQERERAQQQLQETRALEGDARSRLAQADAELSREEAALAELRAELDLARQVLSEAQARARLAREQLEEVNEELAEAEAEFDLYRTRLENRIRATFKYGSVSFAEAFSGVRDIADFLNHAQYVSHVLGNDREIVGAVEESLAHVEGQRALARRLRIDAEADEAQAAAAAARIEEATAEQRVLAESVRDLRRQRAVALEAVREDRASIEGHLAGLEAESARIQAQLAEIARRQAEEAHRKAVREWEKAVEAYEKCVSDNAQAEADHAAAVAAATEAGEEPPEAPEPKDCGTRPPSSPPAPPASVAPGDWVRPVNGRLSSPFGPRWGRFHYGVDLANSMGTPVRAAQSGEVVWRVSGCNPTSSWGCGGGFGNYLVIDHGGGFATVYAHLSTSSVSTGSRVSAGQTIGSVGNSGNSYGAHLHFELYDGGTRRNPCNYISC